MAKTDYHFTFGDSNDGALGMCAVVRADSRKEAVKILQDQFAEMENEYSIHDGGGDDEIQYVRLYLNHKNVSDIDIDDETEVDEDKPENDDYDEEAGILDEDIATK